MKIIRKVNDMITLSHELKNAHLQIGFVPTMGYLHEGHTTLMETSIRENEVTIVSIFINPLQFGPNEDFDQYPRDEKRDIDILKKHQVDYLFLPDVQEIYPSEPTVSMTVQNRTNVLCGKRRPGHFDGVVTVLSKLFHITKADFAYFGMKDAQQVAVIQGLVEDLNFPIQIRPVPTVRENDGLARSSRNIYLSNQERKQAPHLYRSLKLAEQLIIDGEINPVIIIEEVKKYLSLHTDGKLDYVELLSYPELKPIQTIGGQIIIALAVFFGKARLIDNIVIQVES
ncbi:pantoate--beta-alanine ligase [Gracilibacillus dipsosauri]|uniref:Pantothenate synthetase n=1 Tax=Gracilibacillus dipsosauri TaxID=178340 RepID=A0A317KYP0_9BACI|nr:pantoate--beta-alanine ligase [Gracilibacillus dipsosauri]PWU68662.1 pantoate--beta-alanine ligase [Gracilibacillus dipsosauri]